MTSMPRATLEEYARRRFALAGGPTMKDRYPYCTAMEVLDVQRHSVGQPTRASFAHYDYLDLARDPRVLEAARRAIDELGVGAGASRLVGGELASHRLLENEIAEFLGVESALCLISGYVTNVSLIKHLVTRDDLVLVDEAAHNSVMVGAEMSRGGMMRFRHNDLDHLAALLAQHRSSYNRVVVAVEGLYSMDGDIPDLPRLIELCQRHSTWLAVDEAHSIGVLGATGRGITEHFGLPASSVDLVIGTMSKAFVSCGGIIGGKQPIIEWLRYTLPGFVYSVALPPPIVAAVRSALAIIVDEPWRVTRLKENSAYFLREAKRRGLDVGSAVGVGIVPVLYANIAEAIQAGKAALTAGYYVPPIVQIAVPRDAPRLRFFVTAGHSKSEIDGVLDVLGRPASAGETATLAASGPRLSTPGRGGGNPLTVDIGDAERS